MGMAPFEKEKVPYSKDDPFQVVRKTNNNAYELDLPPSYNMSHTFNVVDLSHFDVGFKNS